MHLRKLDIIDCVKLNSSVNFFDVTQMFKGSFSSKTKSGIERQAGLTAFFFFSIINCNISKLIVCLMSPFIVKLLSILDKR